MPLSHRLLVVLVAATVTGGGCASPFAQSSGDPGPSPEPRPELSAPASSLPSADQPGPAPAAPHRAAGASTSAPPDPAARPGGEGPADSGTPATAPPRVLATVEDGLGDAGLQAPAYADLATVLLADTGSALRVTVDMAGDVPGRLGDGEVQGVGIDLFHSGGGESDYQVFLDGGVNGWRAYLQTPEGFVVYPGAFAVGGRRLVAEVPWSALGQRREAQVSVFSDWSARAVPLNRVGSDRAPDMGRATIGP